MTLRGKLGTVTGMTDTEEVVIPKDFAKMAIVSVVAAALLFGLTLLAYRHANSRPGNIILPGGITYLGPSPTVAPVTGPGGIELYRAEESDPTKTWEGSVYPYTFEYPESLNLGLFPGDEYDSVTQFWKDTNANENIILRVEDLTKTSETRAFIGKPLEEYARFWGSQYVWTDLDNASDFTNGQGLKSLWVKFKDASGNVSGDNYFLAVPGKPEIIIWMSPKYIEPKTFDRLVNSLAWKGE